jgi:hypothetical protein
MGLGNAGHLCRLRAVARKKIGAQHFARNPGYPFDVFDAFCRYAGPLRDGLRGDSKLFRQRREIPATISHGVYRRLKAVITHAPQSKYGLHGCQAVLTMTRCR